MAQGFYEILGIDNRSSTDAIHAAYHDQLAGLVRRLRAARRQGADVTILEGQERFLKEAMQVLSDPVRRQRYDAYRRASRQGIPTSAETMWDVAKDSLVDPLAIASLEVLQKTTELNIGNPFKVAPQPRKWSARPQATPAPQTAAQPDTSNEVTDQVERTAELPPPPPQAPAPATEPVVPSFSPEVQAASEPAPPPPPPDDVAGIAARYGMDGRFLRAVRELRQRTLEELADETRISLRYLHALESNDFDSLPAATFVRGYVKELTRALDIQDVDVVESYLGLYKQQRG
jgi:hypothetical protein